MGEDSQDVTLNQGLAAGRRSRAVEMDRASGPDAAHAEPIRCDGTHRARYKGEIPVPCTRPARFRIESTDARKEPPEDNVCGRHVRAYALDNAESVRQPWIITDLSDLAIADPTSQGRP